MSDPPKTGGPTPVTVVVGLPYNRLLPRTRGAFSPMLPGPIAASWLQR
ncbi:hypothetical protein ANAEL_04869 [Anaerolineales bacterium]|nr:hypothetical protein ANAEL_04869 [Anaerolineales bacterium]